MQTPQKLFSDYFPDYKIKHVKVIRDSYYPCRLLGLPDVVQSRWTI